MSTRREFLAGSAALSVANRLVGGTERSTGSNSIMRSYRLPHTDLEVSRIAFGCDLLVVREGASPDSLSTEDIAHAAQVVNVARENGITLFDTAEVYGGGTSEAALGQVLAQSRGLRHKVVIQTKCDGLQSRVGIISSAEGSLKRLGTEYLDILLLHGQDPLMEPQEVASAFEELKRSGKVRYFGVSNHTIGRIELLKRFVRQPLVVNQIHLGLAHSGFLDEPYWTDGLHIGPYTAIAGLDYSRLNDMQVQAYSPLRGKSVVGKAEMLGPPTEAPTELKEVASKLQELATKKATTPAAVALAWLLRHPGRILPVIGAKRTEHILESCAADRVELSEEEWYALFAAAPKDT